MLLPLSSTWQFAFEDGWGPFWDAISDPEAINAFENSIIIATVVTLINIGTGIIIAFAITRYDFPGKRLFQSAIDIPLAIPTSVVGLSLLMLYGPMGVLGPSLDANGIEIMMAMPGIVLAHVFVTFPFMVRSISVSLDKIDPSHEEAARTLGASRWQTFFHVTMPAIQGGILAGAALTFTRSLGEFGSTLFVAGGMVQTGPTYVYHLSNSDFNLQAASSMAVLLMVFPFILLLTFTYLAGRMERR